MEHNVIKFFVCALVGIFTIPLATANAEMASNQVNAVTLDYTDDVQIGEPWVMSKVTPIKQTQCIESFDYSESAIDSGYKGHKVTNTSDIQNALGVSITATARNLVGSATFKANFSKKVQTSRKTSTFIGRAHAEKTRTIKVQGSKFQSQVELLSNGYGFFHVGDKRYPYAAKLDSLPSEIRLTEKAKQKLAKSRKAFEDYCGNGYVYKIFEGVEVYGYLKINQVSGSVETSANAMMTGGTSNFEAGIEAYKKAKQADASIEEDSEFIQYGGGSGSIQPTDLDQFFKAVNEVRKEVGIKGKPTRVVIASYETIPDCRESVNCPSFQNNEFNVILRSYQINALESTLHQIDDVIENQGAVYAIARSQVDLRTLRNQVSGSLTTLKESTRLCISRNETCEASIKDSIDLTLKPQLQLPLAYAAYPRQDEYQLTVAAYKNKVVERTLSTAKQQLCEQFFARDSVYCGEVYNKSPQQMVAFVSPVTPIRSSDKKYRDGGDPYQNVEAGKCLDISRNKDEVGNAVILYGCKRGKKSSRKNQIFGYQNDQLISWNGLCVQKDRKAMRLAKCDRSVPQQTWVYTKSGQLRHGGYCLSSSLNVEPCSQRKRFSWVRSSRK